MHKSLIVFVAILALGIVLESGVSHAANPNTKIPKRIEARLSTRRTIRLSSQSSSTQKPKQSVRNPIAKPVSAPVTPKKASLPRAACGSQDWKCTGWSICSSGIQTRACSIVGDCYFVPSATPTESQRCADPMDAALVTRMEKNLDLWKTFHNQITDAAKALLPQLPASRAGLQTLDVIESSYIDNYNRYLQLHKDYLHVRGTVKLPWSYQYQLEGIEGSMKSLQDQLDALPTVWY
ncbi:MAG: hypothetical protein Greene101449_95 [Candidatus Peregrinibacteria bacterium Greene1014_49]|nr:MAG: hypothetical protein Greene101449_95 [Candidatus Peregrinibacteria bacterium Greene1014_49]